MISKAMERRGEREFDLDAVVELDNKEEKYFKKLKL